MKISYILFISIILLSSQYNIIRDLPYNIYHIEDMNQYENKYIPEGNKFYIRLSPNSHGDIKFHLSIPNNISIFPIYSSDFSKYPSDKEILNIDYKNEIELNNIEILSYSIYTFHIKMTKPYKVLYFLNNEIINYISFYASSSHLFSALGRTYYQNLPMGTSNLYSFVAKTDYYYKVNTDSSSKKTILITTNVESNEYIKYKIDIKHFSYDPSDYEVTNVDNTWSNYLDYDIVDKDYFEYKYEKREYKYKPNEKFEYLAFRIYSDNKIVKMTISIESKEEMPAWLIIIIIVGSIIVLTPLAIAFRAFLRTEKGRECCAILCVCFYALTCSAIHSAANTSKR